MTQLVIRVTQNDPRFGIIAQACNRANTNVARLWSYSNLSAVDGGAVDPVILLAHANPFLFTVDENHPKQRERGDVVVGKLVKEYALDRSKFGFCLIAGCSGASPNLNSLFVHVGHAMGMPTIASTDTIAMNTHGGRVTLKPQNGVWKVFFPYEGGLMYDPVSRAMTANIGGVHDLAAPTCQGFRTKLAEGAFQLLNSDGTVAA